MRSRANIKFPEIYEDNNEFGIENGYWQLKGKHREITIGRRGGGGCPGRIRIAPSGARKDTSIEF